MNTRQHERFFNPGAPIVAAAAACVAGVFLWSLYGPGLDERVLQRVTITDAATTGRRVRVALMSTTSITVCDDGQGGIVAHYVPPRSDNEMPWPVGSFGDAKVVRSNDGCELLNFALRDGGQSQTACREAVAPPPK